MTEPSWDFKKGPKLSNVMLHYADAELTKCNCGCGGSFAPVCNLCGCSVDVSRKHAVQWIFEITLHDDRPLIVNFRETEISTGEHWPYFHKKTADGTNGMLCSSCQTRFRHRERRWKRTTLDGQEY